MVDERPPTSQGPASNREWPAALDEIVSPEGRPSVQRAFYLRGRRDVDCGQLVPLRDHLSLAATALSGPWTEWFITSEDEMLRNASHWLHLAAGLEHVELFLMDDPDDSGMCAWDYPWDLNSLASIYMTEFTRLQYTWNAVDRFLSAVDLPAQPAGSRGKVSQATSALMVHWEGQPLPEHYRCVLRHLKAHVTEWPYFSRIKGLSSAFDESPWRSESGILLAVGNQLRHLPAHGDLLVPDPERVGFSRGEERFPAAAHVPLLGTRALVFSLQMLVAATAPSLSAGTDLERWATLHLTMK